MNQIKTTKWPRPRDVQQLINVTNCTRAQAIEALIQYGTLAAAFGHLIDWQETQSANYNVIQYSPLYAELISRPCVLDATKNNP